MSIAIVFNNKNAESWKKVLKSKLPEERIEVYPNIKNKVEVDFVLCWKPTKNVLGEFPNLKVIQSVGASVEHITKTQKLLSSMQVTRMIDKQLSRDMFEFLLAAVLGYIKNIPLYYQDEKEKLWQQKSYQSIEKTNIFILGLGKIGANAASEFSKLGFKVKGWARSEKQIESVKSYSGEEGLKSGLEDTDILINILPLTAETENILNYELLSCLKKGTYLINVGRGEHLVEEDLLKLLEEEHLFGALLDVFRQEPLPSFHPFWTNKKITITPHIAALTNVESASDVVVENFNRFKNKEELLNLVSLEKGY